MNKVVFNSKSPSETIRIGKTIGSSLQAGDVVALMGELGAGKTQFIKGLAQGVGVGKSVYVSSPSFTLINEYKGEIPFYHIDLYRLEEEKEAEELGLEEYFHGEGITEIDWADRIPSLLPGELLRVNIHYTGKQTRSIELVAKGKRYEELIKIMSSEFVVRSSEQNTE
ncbi:MAG: tRNA (adenosine(37)-N6)-threonylcarbamoyltransferase complex ATPase subunit type 1 TsaE [Deltaproteobacteria bacterium]|nr:tRNA (adenosine(37)-N6)-threonylcarbamoyltransferase complex ATPase subunit type 1 TsaE [Deltaproteobacteria bacterium]